MRISVTTIENFRQYLNDSIEEEELLNRITGKSKPSRYKDLGSAFHWIMENFDKYTHKEGIYTASNGIEFSADIINECRKSLIPYAVYEVKMTKIYDINEPIEVVAKVDSIFGEIVVENKTCWTGFSYDKYYESCQWKFYADIFDVPTIKYNVFNFYDGSDGIVYKGTESFDLHKYPTMGYDIDKLLRDFVEYIHFRNLEKYFLTK